MWLQRDPDAEPLHGLSRVVRSEEWIRSGQDTGLGQVLSENNDRHPAHEELNDVTPVAYSCCWVPTSTIFYTCV